MRGWWGPDPPVSAEEEPISTSPAGSPNEGGAVPEHPREARPSAPGWPEILVGAAVYVAAFFLVAEILPRIADDGPRGIAGLVASGLMGLLAFGAAVLIRIRGLAAFGIRRARPAQLLAGVGLGVAAYLVGTVIAIVYMATSGDMQNIQGSYQAAAAGGALSLIISLLAGAVLTPLGEEAYFRGVLANGLLARLPAWIAIVGNAAIFALAHGINPIMGVAFAVGLFAALLFRWSGSIWPGVLVHLVNNTIGLLVPLVIAMAMG